MTRNEDPNIIRRHLVTFTSVFKFLLVAPWLLDFFDVVSMDTGFGDVLFVLRISVLFVIPAIMLFAFACLVVAFVKKDRVNVNRSALSILISAAGVGTIALLLVLNEWLYHSH